jgi:O-succinylbenzoic acid--CoA ligase
MDWLSAAAASDGSAPALVTRTGEVSYAALDAAADGVAAALAASGVRPGEPVALWGEPEPRTAAALWGIPRAGAVAVPLTPGLPAGPARELTGAAGARIVWDRVDDELGPPARGSPPGEWGGPPDEAARFVLFTSGSRGRPKGVVITGATIAASTAASRERLENGPADRWLCALPLSHVAGLSILWRSARERAAVVLEPGFDARTAAHILAEGRATFASLVPTMLRRVLDAGPARFEGARAVLVGGGPVEAALLERALDAGLPVLQTYGMTETVGQVATVAPAAARADLGTAGRPLGGVEIRIVDADGATLGPESAGRIEVQGPVVSPGYLGEPERDPGEWFRTGDLGSLDSAGRLILLGRADDMIVTGGENVHPAQVEDVLRGIDGVVDVLVYGEDDAEWGRVVAADVVLDRDLLGSVQAAARAALPGHMVPKRWRSVGRIERDRLGKAQPPG